MKNNKVYMPADAIARHKDFDVWYADGEPFLSIRGTWSSERDKACIFGRMGGEMGSIKPDAKALTYYLKLERWEYVFHTRRIFSDYYVNGMRWQINGTLRELPLDFVCEDNFEKDVHVRVVEFRNRGECYEIKAKDVAKLRIAVTAVIAMGIKEEYRGLSEGIDDPNASKLKKAKRWMFAGKGKTYEQLLEEEAASEQSRTV
ncbi:hypothetical protein [Raoultibacter phocaeensis]|uniref:hypothetical protein n=1 Tax=Raoultibacter phocaeensis TaxID=2479841 RepID=UPI001118A74A|nr:hypothetical protein [Raoultibacter phocaeensis]